MELLLKTGVWDVIFGLLLAFISLAIIGIVLIQKEKGGGLSGAFGGSGSTATFGVKTSAVVEKATWFLFILFVVCTFSMAAVSAKNNSSSEADKAAKEKTAVENSTNEGSGKKEGSAKTETPEKKSDTSGKDVEKK